MATFYAKSPPTGGGGGSSVSSIGTIDSQTKSANGAVVVAPDLFMQTADATHPGLVSATAQTIAGSKTLSDQLLASSGTLGAPGVSFSGDTDTGVYRVGANDVSIVAGGHAGLDIKDNGTYANVGMGGAASASSNYPLLLQRSNVSTGTYVQISNPATDASSKATYQLAADNGLNVGEVSVFSAATTTDAYAGRMTVRASDSTSGLSLIAGDGATNTVRVYTAGDYASTGKAAEFTSQKALTLPQSLASGTCTTPASGITLMGDTGVFKTKNSSGTVASLTGANTGDQTITLTGGVTGSGTGSFAATVVTNANLTGGVTSVGNAATVVTNANLTGDVTSVGNATTAAASQTNITSIANLATVGTITSGTWSATTIALNKGGTGQTTKAAAFDALQPMTTGGDLIYGGASGTGTRLANGSAGQFLKSAGGTSAPTWATLVGPTKQIFTSGTAATYTTPANCVGIKVTVVGGGGGGGASGAASGGEAGGGGGGAGGCSILWIASPSASYKYTVGAGGSGGVTGGSAATAGGTSNFTTTVPATLASATGGGLGTASTGVSAVYAGGTGGVGSVGDFNFGGGSGGSGGFGVSAVVQGIGGVGGSSFFGGGATAHASAQNYGAGGGGGEQNGGGAGSGGVVVVEEYY